MLDDDLVAEVAGRPGTGMGDQRLSGVEFKRGGFAAQEPRQLVFDALGFGFRPGEPQENIVGVTRCSAAAGTRGRMGSPEGMARICRWYSRALPRSPFLRACLSWVAVLSYSGFRAPACPSGAERDQDRLGKDTG